ncbi:hypothetical protein D915_008320 [Fasciola hepatica]|uniref:Uncharacterized protein n=1 Tax=Fasciola hepatica TaxID=6192 RepID=A0A4E0RUA7_FASHE|nr:hypothetical protein D915_008320 [Fasciola hepatica]
MRHSVALEYDLVTHLMRDLRSGHETCRTSQSLRRLRRTCVRGGRRVFRYRSMNDRRRKPGHAHRSTFTGRRRKARFQCTDTVTESTPYVRISPLDVTHVARSATNNSSLKPDKNGQEAVKPVFDQISRQGKQRSRSFENLCTSGDYLGLFNERTECSTCLLSNGNVMGNHISESVHSKLSHCTPPCSLSCASVTNCPNLSSENGSTSSENTDSGVFSGDSCAQSTVSTASNSTDTFAPTSVPVTTASQGFIRRLRSRSDSFDPASLTKTHRTKPFDFFASLIELRRKDNRVSHNIAPVEVGDWTTEEMTKQQICELPNSSKTITKIAQENNNADQSRGLLVAACAHRKPHENSYQLCSKKIGHESNFFVEYPWLKPFARFLNKSELSSLTENLSREQQLRSEIQQLMGHHKRGVRCMKDMCLKPTARIVHDTSVYINETTDSMHNQSSVPMDTLTSARARKLGSSRRMNCKLHPASARPRGRPRKLNSHQGKSPVHRGLSKRGMKQKRAGPGRPRTRF